MRWVTVKGRPVLIEPKTGRIVGGKVPRSWQGKTLKSRPWAKPATAKKTTTKPAKKAAPRKTARSRPAAQSTLF